MSRQTLDCDFGEAGASGTYCVWARDAAECLAIHNTIIMIKNYLAQNVNSAVIEKAWGRIMYNLWIFYHLQFSFNFKNSHHIKFVLTNSFHIMHAQFISNATAAGLYTKIEKVQYQEWTFRFCKSQILNYFLKGLL
jgi:hypothetical protein